MLFRFTLLMFMLHASSAFAGDVDYSTTCKISDGAATGYISVRRPATLSFSGEIFFYVYDENGEQILQQSVVTGVTVTSNDLVEVDSIYVPTDAYSCAVDVSVALGNSTPRRNYMTSCIVEDGVARGYIQLQQGAALSFSGRIYFYFFAEDGDYLDEDFTVESVVVIGRNRVFVGQLNADPDVYSCILDVSDAVN